jgi:hypothetical protein
MKTVYICCVPVNLIPLYVEHKTGCTQWSQVNMNVQINTAVWTFRGKGSFLSLAGNRTLIPTERWTNIISFILQTGHLGKSWTASKQQTHTAWNFLSHLSAAENIRVLHYIILDTIRFWRWCIAHRDTGFSDFFRVSETGSVSVLRWGKTPTLLGPLERASLNHWILFREGLGTRRLIETRQDFWGGSHVWQKRVFSRDRVTIRDGSKFKFQENWERGRRGEEEEQT